MLNQNSVINCKFTLFFFVDFFSIFLYFLILFVCLFLFVAVAAGDLLRAGEGSGAGGACRVRGALHVVHLIILEHGW